MVFVPARSQGVGVGIHRMCVFRSHLLRRGVYLQGVVMIMANGTYGCFGQTGLMDTKHFQQMGLGCLPSIGCITELKSLVFGM